MKGGGVGGDGRDRGGSPLLPSMSMSGFITTSMLNKTNKLMISTDMSNSVFDFTGSHSNNNNDSNNNNSNNNNNNNNGGGDDTHLILPPLITSSVYTNAHILPHPMRKNNLLSYDTNPDSIETKENEGIINEYDPG
jgi:hypothetical protein